MGGASPFANRSARGCRPPAADAADLCSSSEIAIARLPNFDRIARPYRWLEYLLLGPLLQRTRTHFLPLLPGRGCALLLGDGDGRFTAALLARNPHQQAEAVDLSEAMLTLLRRKVERVSAQDRLRTRRADVRCFAPQGQPELVATHFLLDCLSQAEVDSLVARLAPLLAPDALWLVSEFRVPAGLFRWPARVLIRLLYLAFRVLTGLRTTHLPEHTAPLTRAGFRPLAIHRTLFGMLSSELWRR